jgi:hypothetical protein
MMKFMSRLPGHACAVLVVVAISCLSPLGSEAVAQQSIYGNMTWMTHYPSTWNAGAPKIVSDGLHFYVAFCGLDGSEKTCGVARKRGDGIESWTIEPRRFEANQPAALIIDRKGRLNIFYNDLQLRLHHLRLDHPSVNLADWSEIPVNFTGPVGYLHASYDAVDDIIMLAFAETGTWTTYFGVKHTDANTWMMAPLPPNTPGTLLMYARALRANGRYYLLLSEHIVNGPNANYSAAVMFDSSNASGPWTRRDLHRITGTNLGIPYQNWVLANDLQADANGNVRALLHITENGSGHAGALDGLYLLRQEDGYLPQFIGSAIEDGYSLYVDPSGAHVAFGRGQVQVSPFVFQPGIVWYRSDDGGVTWNRNALGGYPREVNPSLVDLRNGSMAGPSLRYIASLENQPGPIFDTVVFNGLALQTPSSDTRYDYEYLEADGTWDYLRAYTDAGTGRSYYYIYDYDSDSSFSVTYSYTAGSYYQVYIADSDGSYRYYNSDGFQVSYQAPQPPQITAYWYDDAEDGARNYLYLHREPAAELLWWVIYDFNSAGGYDLTYVYYRGTYWYLELRSADGHYTRSDSTGFYETG